MGGLEEKKSSLSLAQSLWGFGWIPSSLDSSNLSNIEMSLN